MLCVILRSTRAASRDRKGAGGRSSEGFVGGRAIRRGGRLGVVGMPVARINARGGSGSRRGSSDGSAGVGVGRRGFFRFWFSVYKWVGGRGWVCESAMAAGIWKILGSVYSYVEVVRGRSKRAATATGPSNALRSIFFINEDGVGDDRKRQPRQRRQPRKPSGRWRSLRRISSLRSDRAGVATI